MWEAMFEHYQKFQPKTKTSTNLRTSYN